MSNLTLKNILPSDTFSDVVNKINYNNDQILEFGGGRTGPAGRQGDSGLPGATGAMGPTGADGVRGSEIFSSSTILVDGSACTITGAMANDWAIDSTGNYCLIVPDPVHGGLKFSLQFNVISSSAIDFVTSETNYTGHAVTGAVDRWRLKDGGTSGSDRNLVFAKRISDGVSNDVSDFYRLIIGADQYPTAANVMLTIVNIIPDPALTGTAVSASASPFYQIALKYRKDSSSLPELNSAYIYYKEATPAAHKLGYMLHENGSGGLAIIYDLTSPSSTTTLKGDNIQFISSIDDYVTPVNPVSLAIISSGTPSSTLTFNSTSTLVFTGATPWIWNLKTLKITNQLSCNPADALLVGSSSKFNMNVQFTVGSSLTFTPNILSDSGGGVLNVNNPNFTGSGINSTSTLFNYNLSTGVSVTPVITSIIGGTAGQTIIIYVQTSKGLKIGGGANLLLKRGNFAVPEFFPQGEYVTFTCIDGTIWKETSSSMSEFYGNRATSLIDDSPLSNPNVLGFHTFPATVGSASPANTPPSGTPVTMGRLNFFDNALDAPTTFPHTMQQQFEWLGTSDPAAPVSDKYNPIYTRRKSISAGYYTGRWNKLLSQYGGNAISDRQDFYGSILMKPVTLALTVTGGNVWMTTNGASPGSLVFTGAAWNLQLPSATLQSDDSAASMYHISVRTSATITGGNDVIYLLLPAIISGDTTELGRRIIINIALSPTATQPLYFVFQDTTYGAHSGCIPTAYTTILGGTYEAYYANDSTKSLTVEFVAVPWNNESISTKLKWVVMSSTISNGTSRLSY